jgi:polar amino acid transport system substrate-binding protein
MRAIHRLLGPVLLALLLGGCASLDTGTGPTPAERQAVAPTGKLRVALQLGAPHNAVRDPVSGEMKGVGFDLGRELGP